MKGLVKIIVAFFLGGFFLLPAHGKKKPTFNFWPIEESLQQRFNEIRETVDDSLAIRLHRQIEDILAETLTIPQAFQYQFDSLRTIGKIYAPRKDFRILNWNHSNRDGTFQYFALMVIPGNKDEPNKVIRMRETVDSIVRPEQQTLSADQWLGCLYYKITPKKRGKDGTEYYTLLGLDMHNLKTRRKIVEILSFDPKGNPQFGAPIIELNQWTKHRAIFEFGAQHNMYLEYNRFRRRIEMDHLAPPMPYLVGRYEFYEPDQFRDALKFKRGQWKHIRDIEKPKDAKMNKRSLPKPPKPVKPPKPPKPSKNTPKETTE